MKQQFRAVFLIGLVSGASLLRAADDSGKSIAKLETSVEKIKLFDIPYGEIRTYSLNGEMVGSIKTRPNSVQDALAEIDFLQIPEKFRGQGIASHILHEALTNLKAEGYQKVRYEVTGACNNPDAISKAVASLKMRGFETVCDEKTRAVMEATL